jgi:hypothetical protein
MGIGISSINRTSLINHFSKKFSAFEHLRGVLKRSNFPVTASALLKRGDWERNSIKKLSRKCRPPLDLEGLRTIVNQTFEVRVEMSRRRRFASEEQEKMRSDLIFIDPLMVGELPTTPPNGGLCGAGCTV